jgi:hypothetical protein
MNHICGLDEGHEVITFHTSKELLNLVRGYEDEGYEHDVNTHTNHLTEGQNRRQPCSASTFCASLESATSSPIPKNY